MLSLSLKTNAVQTASSRNSRPGAEHRHRLVATLEKTPCSSFSLWSFRRQLPHLRPVSTTSSLVILHTLKKPPIQPLNPSHNQPAHSNPHNLLLTPATYFSPRSVSRIPVTFSTTSIGQTKTNISPYARLDARVTRKRKFDVACSSTATKPLAVATGIPGVHPGHTTVSYTRF